MSDMRITDYSERQELSFTDLLLLSDTSANYAKLSLHTLLSWVLDHTRFFSFDSEADYIAHYQEEGVETGDFFFYFSSGDICFCQKTSDSYSLIYTFPFSSNVSWNDVKPAGGVTIYDLANDVQQSISRADTAIQGGIAQSTTAGGTVPKTATLSGYRLTVNSFVAVKFSTPVEASATLNVNSTGAKPIFYRGAAITAGVITYGDTALFVYDGTNYNLIAFDSALREHQSLSGMVPRNQQAQKTNADTVEVKIDSNGKLWVPPGGSTPSGDENTTIITMTYYDGDNYASMTAAEIYAVLDEEDKNFVLIDRAGRQCALIDPPESSSGTAKFVTFDDSNTALVVYAITANGIVTSTSLSVDISGLYTKPAGGIPKTDLSQAVQAGLEEVFPITVTVSGGTVTVDRTLAEIVAAKQAGKVMPVVVDGTSCGWVGYADSGEVVLNYYLGHDTLPTLYQVYMSGNTSTLSSKILEEHVNDIYLSGSTQSIAAVGNTRYHCSTLTSLTLSSFPVSGEFEIVFTSGSTATTVSLPATLKLPDTYTFEANKIYEINVVDGRALISGWPTT